MTLFRREVLEARQQAWLGSIRVGRPVSLTLMTWGVAAAVAAVAAFLTQGHYTRKAHLAGVLVPDRGLIRIIPPVNGTVLEQRVEEGQAVTAGQVLFVLAADEPTLAGSSRADVLQSFGTRERSLADAARQAAALATDRLKGLDDRLSGVQQEMAQLQSQSELQRQRLVLAQQAEARLQALTQDHFVSSAQVQAKTEEVLGLKADAAALDRQQKALAREAAALTAERREVPLQAAVRQGEIERERAQVAEAAARSDTQAAGRQLLVRAPADGRVTAVMVGRGQNASPAASLATLTPSGAQLQAHLYAPSSALGFLRPAQAVQLRLQAFPYQKFGLQPGRVLSIAQAPVQANELAGLPLPAATVPEPMYRVTVGLERQSVTAQGLARPLLAGMQLDADVLLERRRLIEWMAEPLVGLARRL